MWVRNSLKFKYLKELSSSEKHPQSPEFETEVLSALIPNH